MASKFITPNEKCIYNDLVTGKVTESETFNGDKPQEKFFKANYRKVVFESEEKCGNCRNLKGYTRCKFIGDDGSSACRIRLDHVCDEWTTRRDLRTVKKKGR